MDYPLRFGLHFWDLTLESWQEQARLYEDLGFSTITLTDHLVVPQWEPMTALAAIGSVTEAIGLGTLVLNMGLRNPVLTARAAATVDRISGGRLELGVGAGYVAANCTAGGVPFESGADRVARLEESVTLMRQLWREPSTTMHGRFYDVTDSPMADPEPVWLRLLVGGGGPTVMRFAGRVADTASMIPRQTSGEWSLVDSLVDSTVERMAEKAGWVREGAEAAGREADSIELHTMVPRVIVGDDPRAAIAEEAAAAGITPEQMAESSLYLCGTGREVCDQLEHWHEQTGISYFSFFDPGEEQIAYLAEHVVGTLGGGD
jgi:probable F420-dependent oxidoreductase